MQYLVLLLRRKLVVCSVRVLCFENRGDCAPHMDCTTQVEAGNILWLLVTVYFYDLAERSSLTTAPEIIVNGSFFLY